MVSDSNAANPNSLGYYILYVFILLICYIFILLITSLVKSRQNDFNGSMEARKELLSNLTPEQRSLRFKFLLVSTAIKASIWVKAPFVFALYNRLHGFNRGEIGILYAIDNASGLIMGPIIGSLGDLYGRRKFCFLYCLMGVIQISLRLTGSIPLAYIAQIIAGVAGSIIETAFESWLNFEASLLFPNSPDGKSKRNNFLRDIFSKQVNIDCYTSIVLTGFASIIYIKYGIEYPFYACILFTTIAGIIILLSWNENDIDSVRMERRMSFDETINNTFREKLKFSWGKLKEDKALMSLGVIESCFRISMQLFIFIWTPLLEETAGGYILPGSVFICFMIARLMGSGLFDLFKIILQTNSYIISVFITFSAAASFLIEYSFAKFNVRFFMFVYLDGLTGILNPLLSSLKSQMIPEKLRTTIMNFFRIPINICSIIILISTDYVSTYQICLVAFIIMLAATIVNCYLIYIHEPPDSVKNEVQTTVTNFKGKEQVQPEPI